MVGIADHTTVALRKESVDRNSLLICKRFEGGLVSLSARRAWIEIVGGIDNNGSIGSRSPQGERG